ncbi:unnamed protein product [Mytilus coruscus]|uniref:Uncharacterized protein n=1 Tax=Mytilus coruscus TaxID=42192 RepID=A0A6J8B056_MYTCO|nr:unnamed protein product [Mytilus coruscus]
MVRILPSENETLEIIQNSEENNKKEITNQHENISRGLGNQGLVKNQTEDRGNCDPINSKINFAVPNKTVLLSAPSAIPKIMKPGVLLPMLEYISKSFDTTDKTWKVCVDLKKINSGKIGDLPTVDLWGKEDPPTKIESLVKTNIYNAKECINGMLELIDRLCHFCAFLNGKENEFVSSKLLLFQRQNNYSCLTGKVDDVVTPENTRHIRQRSEGWFELRKESKVTASTLLGNT